MKKYYSEEEISKFRSKYENHHAQKESHDLALKQMKKESKFGDVFITFDFKRNPVIGNFGAETSKQYYKRFEITCLGAEIEYKNEQGDWIKKYDITLSKEIKHNADNTISWIENFLLNRMANIYGVNPKKLYLCFDTGKHFKCNQVIDYLRGYSTEVNFDLYYVSYVPYHGKTSLDQLFSTVGVVFNGKSNIPEVSDAVRIGNERFKSFDVSNLEFNQKNPTKRQKKIHNVTFHEFQPIQKIRKETQLNIKDITKILFIKFDGDGDLELFSNIRDYNLKTKSKNKIEVKVVESEESKNQKKLEKEKKSNL